VTPLAQPALAGKELSERSIFSKETIGRLLMITNGYQWLSMVINGY
jgi:hypothetical protein